MEPNVPGLHRDGPAHRVVAALPLLVEVLVGDDIVVLGHLRQRSELML